MSFKSYINERKKIENVDIKDIIKERERLYSDFRSLSGIIAKESQRDYKLALELMKPQNTLSDINPKNLVEANNIKKFAELSKKLVEHAEKILYMPYYGPEEEKKIKTDFENISKAISLIYTVKLNENLNESPGPMDDGSPGDKFDDYALAVSAGLATGPLAPIATPLMIALAAQEHSDNSKKVEKNLRKAIEKYGSDKKTKTKEAKWTIKDSLIAGGGLGGIIGSVIGSVFSATLITGAWGVLIGLPLGVILYFSGGKKSENNEPPMKKANMIDQIINKEKDMIKKSGDDPKTMNDYFSKRKKDLRVFRPVTLWNYLQALEAGLDPKKLDVPNIRISEARTLTDIEKNLRKIQKKLETDIKKAYKQRLNIRSREIQKFR